MSFNINEERKKYIQELKETYKHPEKANVEAQRFFDFGRALAETNDEDLISNIAKVSCILNKRKYDSFYIPYALFMQYNDSTFDLRDPDFTTTFSEEEKDKNLKESIALLKNKLDNKDVIEQLYRFIRSGDKIEMIYNPEKLKRMIKEIEMTQRITSTVNNMFNEK